MRNKPIFSLFTFQNVINNIDRNNNIIYTCKGTVDQRYCRKNAVDRRERGGAIARVPSIAGKAAVLSILS